MNWIACVGCNFLFARQSISEVGSNPLRGEVNRTSLVWRTLMVGVNLKLPLALLSSVGTQNVYRQLEWLVQGLSGYKGWNQSPQHSCSTLKLRWIEMKRLLTCPSQGNSFTVWVRADLYPEIPGVESSWKINLVWQILGHDAVSHCVQMTVLAICRPRSCGMEGAKVLIE